MFAVIKTGGKQYRVAADDLIEVDKIAGAAGEAVAFAEVLAVGGEDTLLGAPTVAGASVRGEVVEQGRKPKLIAFKKRRRKNSRRKRGHRQEFTRVRITEILTGSSQPKTPKAESAEPAEQPAARKPKAEPAEQAEQPAARKPKVETAEAAAKAAPSSEKESGGPTAGSAAVKPRAETKTPRRSTPPDENAAGEDKSK